MRPRNSANQLDMFEVAQDRSSLDELLHRSRLYTTSESYVRLLEFIAKVPNFAPFNAMLLHLQKPGLTYAASADEWKRLFGREIKPRARPLIILWPFGPVSLVYDVQDTEGVDLPEDAAMFPAKGDITEGGVFDFVARMKRRGIATTYFDAGDAQAGAIGRTGAKKAATNAPSYVLSLNQNHGPAAHFVTIAHELAHLFLGHLGEDTNLKVPPRTTSSHAQREMEAESVAWLVARRNGVTAKSETYLRQFVGNEPKVEIYAVLRAAGQVENLLGIGDHAARKLTKKRRARALAAR